MPDPRTLNEEQRNRYFKIGIFYHKIVKDGSGDWVRSTILFNIFQMLVKEQADLKKIEDHSEDSESEESDSNEKD